MRTLVDQAAELEVLLRDLLRRLFVFDPEDPASDLPVTQLRVLGLVARTPHTLSSLAEEMGCSISAASQLADRLEGAGMVERVPDTQDRRCKRLELTARGREVVRRRTERRVGRAAQALELLEPSRREAVLLAMQELLEASRTLPYGREVEP